MNHKRPELVLLGIAVLLVLTTLGGCGKGSAPKAASDPNAFATASESSKTKWETILSAANSKDYATAILTGRKLQGQADLTLEQRTAVSDKVTELNNELTTAAQKGDQTAIKAIEEMRKRWR